MPPLSIKKNYSNENKTNQESRQRWRFFCITITWLMHLFIEFLHAEIRFLTPEMRKLPPKMRFIPEKMKNKEKEKNQKKEKQYI